MDFNLDFVKQIRLDHVKDYYLRLSERERYIVLGVTSFVVLILVVVTITTAMGSLAKLKRQIRADREIALQMERLKEDYAKSRREVERLEALIDRTPSSFSLTTYLESLAQRFDVSPDSMNPKPAPPNDLYNETQVEVRLLKVTLPALTDYLFNIENSKGVIRINSLNVKPNYTDPAFLNVSFSVSAFTPKK